MPKISLFRIVLMCMGFCAFFLFLWIAAPARAQDVAISRALLIACEEFVIQDSLAPSAGNSVMNMARILAKNNENVHAIQTEINTIGTIEQLESAILRAFGDATEQDVSFFYIATHGNYRPDSQNSQATLSLSDGQVEATFSSDTLRDMLDQIPGTKVVFVDACHSGALIRKGVDLAQAGQSMDTNQASYYKVLTSASANELSWHYSNGGESGQPQVSGSYFGEAVARGLGLYGAYPADLNYDGSITLDELYRYLLQNHAVSTVQVYPQQDDFVLLNYGPEDMNPSTYATISDIRFESESLTYDSPLLHFSFTVREKVPVEYRITYLREGQWDWGNTSRFDDTFDPGSGTTGGPLSVGRKQRSIRLQGIEPESSGYALFQMFTVTERGSRAIFSRLVCVLPTVGDPQLMLHVPNTTFTHLPGAELSIYVDHQFPVRLSLTMYDLAGNMVRRVAENQLSRPIRLTPEGSIFYWDGKDQYGQPLPDGVYALIATSQIGGITYETQPLLFQVIAYQE